MEKIILKHNFNKKYLYKWYLILYKNKYERYNEIKRC